MSAKLSPRWLIVIPTYNEAQNITLIADAINRLSLQAAPDILIVDDNSPDGTGVMAEQISREHSNVFVLRRDKKQGLGKAYLAGFKWAFEKEYSWIMEMDADFSHQPKYLKDFEKEILTGDYDFLIGSRYISGGGTKDWGIFRKLVSRMGSFYSSLVLGCPIHDLTGGFNAWRADVLRDIDLSQIISEGFGFQVELKYKAFKKGFKFKEVPIVFVDRKLGQSKFSPHIMLEGLLKVIVLKKTIR